MSVIDNARTRLLTLYIQRDNLNSQVESTDREITALRNILAGADLAREEDKPKEE